MAHQMPVRIDGGRLQREGDRQRIATLLRPCQTGPEQRQGDAFITNDPWKATGHLSDLTAVTPCSHKGKLIALFACTTHVVDIGGNGPSPKSRHVFGEGLFIPIMRIMSKGRMSEDLLTIVRANVREPIQVEGGIFALVTCNDVGGRRLAKIMEEYAFDDLEEVGAFILRTSRKAMIEAIAKLPKGRWSNRLLIDGYEAPVDLAATVTVDGESVHIDMDGTSPASAYRINCPLCYTEAYAAFGVKCLVAPDLPNNAATLACIKLSAPEDCIANALYPRPVVARSTIRMFLPDLIFGCFEQALSDRVPVESTGSLWNVRVAASRSETAPAFMVTSFHSGGAGARPALDGLSATPFPSGVRNVPVEITEAITPIVVWKKELRTDSGGEGRQRGGLVQIMVVGSRDERPVTLYARFERIDNPAGGRQGGQPGAAGRLALQSGEKLKPKGMQPVPAGESVVLEMPGGGGYGDPALRAADAVALDVRRGYVSAEQALETYKVAINPDGAIDQEATEALRRASHAG